MESVAPRFTAFRRENGLSASKVAARARDRGFVLSRSTVLALESGTTAVRRHHLEAIAAAIGKSIEETHNLFFAPLPNRAAGHLVEL